MKSIFLKRLAVVISILTSFSFMSFGRDAEWHRTLRASLEAKYAAMRNARMHKLTHADKMREERKVAAERVAAETERRQREQQEIQQQHAEGNRQRPEAFRRLAEMRQTQNQRTSSSENHQQDGNSELNIERMSDAELNRRLQNIEADLERLQETDQAAFDRLFPTQQLLQQEQVRRHAEKSRDRKTTETESESSFRQRGTRRRESDRPTNNENTAFRETERRLKHFEQEMMSKIPDPEELVNMMQTLDTFQAKTDSNEFERLKLSCGLLGGLYQLLSVSEIDQNNISQFLYLLIMYRNMSGNTNAFREQEVGLVTELCGCRPREVTNARVNELQRQINELTQQKTNLEQQLKELRGAYANESTFHPDW